MVRPRLPVGTYGTIKTKEDGKKWKASCQFRDSDGKVRKVRCWANTKIQAENTLRERLRDRQISTGNIEPNTKVTFVAERWLADYRERVHLGERSGTSLDTYEHRWQTLLRPRMEGLQVSELTTGRIDTILQEINKTLSASTAKTCRAIISGICGLAVRQGPLSSNPVRDARPIETLKRRKHQRALTVDEAIQIFTLVDNDPIAQRQDLPDIMRYFAGTGNRTGEAVAIRWETIDFMNKTAWIDGNMIRTKEQGVTINSGKSDAADRPIPLAAWLVDMLCDRRERLARELATDPEQLTGWVFPNSIGGLRETSNLRRDWRAFRDRHHIGSWFTPYTFRRTVATLLTDELPTRQASDLLGHSRVSQTTDTYVGRKLPSRAPADVLDVFGQPKSGS